MSSLAARFREIEITFDEPPALPAPWPQGWLDPTTSAAVLRFVDSQFNADSTPAEIRQAFPSARAVSINPMPLRAIFVSLAKSARKANLIGRTHHATSVTHLLQGYQAAPV